MVGWLRGSLVQCETMDNDPAAQDGDTTNLTNDTAQLLPFFFHGIRARPS
jgi:hypothetical protein